MSTGPQPAEDSSDTKSVELLNDTQALSLSLSPQVRRKPRRICWGAVEQGSLLSGALTLFACIGGSGMVALPYAFRLAGYGTSVAVVILGMGVNCTTCYILADYARKKGVITLDQLCKEVFEDFHWPCLSPKWEKRAFKALYWFTGFNTWINYYGALIAYIIVVRETQIQSLFPQGLYVLRITAHETSHFIWGPVLMVFVIFPLSTFKFKNLRFISIVNFLSVVYAGAAIMVISAYHMHSGEYVSQGSADFNGIFIMVPIVVFSYTCQPDMGFITEVPCTQQLNKGEHSLPVILVANGLWLLLFLGVGLLGYISVPHIDQQDVLIDSDFSYSNIAGGLVHSTQAMISACIALISCIPILIYPIVDVVFNMFGDSQSRTTRLCRYSIIASEVYSVLEVVALGIAIAAREQYGLFLGFLGAISCAYASVILPCLSYVCNPPTDSPSRVLTVLCWILIVATLIVLVASIIALVQQPAQN